MAKSVLQMILQGTDALATKEYYSAIAAGLGGTEVGKGTGKVFRSKLLNKSVHSMSIEDVEVFMKQHLKDRYEPSLSKTLFAEYIKEAMSSGLLIHKQTIYTVSSDMHPNTLKNFELFINHKPITPNALNSIINSIPNVDSFKLLQKIVAKAHKNIPKTEDNRIFEFINSGTDIGHVKSNIQYLSDFGVASGILTGTPSDIGKLYDDLEDPQLKAAMFSRYKQELLDTRSALGDDVSTDIFNTIYDSQLELLRYFKNKDTFSGSIKLTLTRRGAARSTDLNALKRIVQKTIVKVAPQNSALNQKIGREIEAFYRTHLPKFYRAFFDSWTKKVEDQGVLDIKGSKSIRQFISDQVADIITIGTSKQTQKLSTVVKSNTAKKSKGGKSVKKSSGHKGRVSNKKGTTKLATLRNATGQFTSIVNVERLLTARLTETIKQNMTPPALVNRTGRFAESVELKSVQRDQRSGAITAFLTYMKYPYATFEPGGRQGSSQRSPTKLIDRSVREIAKDLVTERMRVVVV